MSRKKSRRSNQDSAWKDMLDAYFQAFMELFYLKIAEKIDWTAGYETLDKELQAITTDAMIGKRFVDKLFKVKTLEGQEEVILIHIEIQGKKEKEFSKRLFQYYCKLFTKHNQSILTLAILTDDNRNWHPKNYQKEIFGFSIINFNFQSNKLLDYQNKKQALSKSTNPFATVILVHLAFIETKNNLETRCQMKFSLTRPLYEKGYNRNYVINLLKVIDWALVLPEDLELEYKSKVHKLEEEKNMSYITSFERLGREKGLRQGLEEGREQGLEQGLEQGFQKAVNSIEKVMRSKGLDQKTIQEILSLSKQGLEQEEA